MEFGWFIQRNLLHSVWFGLIWILFHLDEWWMDGWGLHHGGVRRA